MESSMQSPTKVTSIQQLIDLANNGRAVYHTFWQRPGPASFFMNWRLKDVKELIDKQRLEIFEKGKNSSPKNKIKNAPAPIAEVMMRGGALQEKSEHYPSSYMGMVPALVMMAQTVQSDLPGFLAAGLPKAIKGIEYWVNVNSHGAVSVIFEDGSMLGLKSGEFVVTLYHPC